MATASEIVVGDRRITPEEVVSRMGEIASEDETYRRQLVGLAASRDGIYRVALTSLHELEAKTLEQSEAEERARPRRGAVRCDEGEAFQGHAAAHAGGARRFGGVGVQVA